MPYGVNEGLAAPCGVVCTWLCGSSIPDDAVAVAVIVIPIYISYQHMGNRTIGSAESWHDSPIACQRLFRDVFLIPRFGLVLQIGYAQHRVAVALAFGLAQ